MSLLLLPEDIGHGMYIVEGNFEALWASGKGRFNDMGATEGILRKDSF
jgi:hypothetical protein